MWEEGRARGGAELCGCSLAQLLETALEAPHQANIWLLRNPGQCYVLVQWKQCLVLLWAPSCLFLCEHGSQEEDAWNFPLYSPLTAKANQGCDWTPCCWRGGNWAFSLALEGLFSFLLIILSSWHAATGTGDPGPDPRKVAACIALRASKPLCTAERLRKSLGTSASPPQLYPPHCARWWQWNKGNWTNGLGTRTGAHKRVFAQQKLF